MRVLGIDPGFGRCGIAVIEKTNGSERYLFSTCVETSKDIAFEERLDMIVLEIELVIREWKPESAALERLYFSKNQKTGMQVAEARGAILLALERSGLPIKEYTPGQIKSASAGYGAADKSQVARMLKTLLKIEKDIRHDDEWDSIAVALTHAVTTR